MKAAEVTPGKAFSYEGKAYIAQNVTTSSLPDHVDIYATNPATGESVILQAIPADRDV
ncbi:MAG TPA: hypothetical protein VLI05_06515 [Candidatus Saccharimonadia bacterium]|nr:hypothetical protein [Candidatus Saccharimonadia bacterium]